MVSNLEARNLLNLRPALMKWLGEVSVRHGQIEHLFTMTIHRTARISYDDAFAEVKKLGRKDIRRKARRAFKKWALAKFDETEGTTRVELFDDLIENWKGLWDQRDDVIHCCWSVGRDDDQLTCTRRGALLTTDDGAFGIEDVELLAKNLKQFVLLLNRATEPTMVSVPEDEIAAIPDRFTPGWAVPANWDTSATAVGTFTIDSSGIKPTDN